MSCRRRLWQSGRVAGQRSAAGPPLYSCPSHDPSHPRRSLCPIRQPRSTPAWRRRLRVAQGQEPADLVLAGGEIVDIFGGDTYQADIAICDGVIAGVGSYPRARERLDVAGKWISRRSSTRTSTPRARWSGCQSSPARSFRTAPVRSSPIPTRSPTSPGSWAWRRCAPPRAACRSASSLQRRPAYRPAMGITGG